MWFDKKLFNALLASLIIGGLVLMLSLTDLLGGHVQADDMNGDGSALARPLPQALPAAPTGLVAELVSDSEIRLTWTDNAQDETSYRVERSPFDALIWIEIASLDANTTVYLDSDLTCDSSYFYRVRAFRESDRTFSDYSELVPGSTDYCRPGYSVPFTDTFTDMVLNPGWRLYDPYAVLGPPQGRADLALTGANVELIVSEGMSHDLWTGASNWAPRLLQPIPNRDFGVEVRFESVPTTRFQLQGIIVQQDDDTFLRLDVFYDSQLLAFAGYVNGDRGTSFVSEPVVGVVDEVYLRLLRHGDDWEYYYSPDGRAWTLAASFTQSLLVTEVGFFAGNHDPAPPYRGSVDYFMNLANPVTDTDGVGADSPAPPASPVGLQSVPGEGQVELTWEAAADVDAGEFLIERTTNAALEAWTEVARVDVGSTAYQDTAVGCGLDYQYRLRVYRAGDGRFSPYSEPVGAPSGACVDNPDGPVIDVYYVDEQDTLSFGRIGNPARWLNVLGNVSDPDGIESVVYVLDGGLEQPVPLGPDGLRLHYPGDFNIEIDRFALENGQHSVLLKATDSTGAITYRPITVHYTDENTWPIPYSVDWRTVENITDVAQVIDGKWELTPDGLHIVDPGYDRLVAIGQDTWESNYEVYVTLTINDGPNDSEAGVVLGWQGHEGITSPHTDWPLETLAWMGTDLRRPRLRFTAYPGTIWEEVLRPDIVAGIPYVLHARSEYLSDSTARVAMNVWAEGTPEPDGWQIISDLPARDGSLLLITHLGDITFHTVEISPLSTDLPSPPISLTPFSDRD